MSKGVKRPPPLVLYGVSYSVPINLSPSYTSIVIFVAKKSVTIRLISQDEICISSGHFNYNDNNMDCQQMILRAQEMDRSHTHTPTEIPPTFVTL